MASSENKNFHDWVATDLDGTLFSRAWQAPGAVPGTWRRGPNDIQEPSSWLKRETHRLLTVVAERVRAVPVTARDRPSFDRVGIEGVPFNGPLILANGAMIMRDRDQTDLQWAARMDSLLVPLEDEMAMVCDRLLIRSAGEARPRLVMREGERPAYVVAKAKGDWWKSRLGAKVIESLSLGKGWDAKILGTELQVLPPGVSKLSALEYVQDRYFDGVPPLLCLGDMAPDLAFMRAGALWATPTGSSLDKLLNDEQ